MMCIEDRSFNCFIHTTAAKLLMVQSLKSLGEKSYEIKGGSQEMAVMMLMLISFNNAHSFFTEAFE